MVAPCLPVTAWCTVPDLRLTLIIWRRACSIAFWTPTGTLFRFAFAHTDAAVAVADNSQRREGHDATALHHFGDAVDADHLLAKTITRLFGLLYLGRAIRVLL